MPRTIIDLSIFLENDVLSDPPAYRPRIEYIDHKRSIRALQQLFPGLRPEDLPDGEAWAIERIRIDLGGTQGGEGDRLLSSREASQSGGLAGGRLHGRVFSREDSQRIRRLDASGGDPRLNRPAVVARGFISRSRSFPRAGRIPDSGTHRPTRSAESWNR